MTMRETPRSLGIYLEVAGLISLASLLSVIFDPEIDWLGKLFAFILMIISAAYIYAGCRCSILLSSNPKPLFRILQTGILFNVAIIALILIGSEFAEVPLSEDKELKSVLFRCGISIVVTIYLLVNAHRLSMEARENAGQH